MTGQPPANGTDTPSLIAAVATVATLVASGTATIMARLEAIERGEMTRWRLHDEELERNRGTITAKFLKVEKALDDHIVLANAHFQRERDDDLVMQARVQPVRTSIAWVAANYKNIVILLIGILGFVAVATDILARYLGGTP